MIVTEIKISLNNSDDTKQEISSIIPFEIANRFFCDLITWKDDIYTSVKTTEDFQRSSEEFKNKTYELTKEIGGEK